MYPLCLAVRVGQRADLDAAQADAVGQDHHRGQVVGKATLGVGWKRAPLARKGQHGTKGILRRHARIAALFRLAHAFGRVGLAVAHAYTPRKGEPQIAVQMIGLAGVRR
ncbi:hypothetical protein D3C71_1007010 [compost metagenome]